jgi:HK97 family phage portal protein
LKLTKKFWAYVAKKTARFIWTEAIDIATGSPKADTDPQVETLTERTDPDIATCARIISGAISWLPLNVKRIEHNAEGKIELVDADDHPINEILNNPNPTFGLTKAELMTHIAQSLFLAGDAYISCLPTGIGNRIELQPFHPKRVEIATDKTTGIPLNYIIDKNQPDKKRTIAIEDMIHIRLYNINDPYYGKSIIQPLQRQILTDLYLENYNKAYFKNDCTPTTTFSPEFDMDPEQINKFKKALKSEHGGVDNKFKLLVTTIKGVFQKLSPDLKDMAFREMSELNREKKFSTAGVPPTAGGVFRYSNYANSVQEDKSLWRNTLIPFLNIIADSLTRQLLWNKFERDHILIFDLSGVQALQEDRESQARTLGSHVTRGIITANEARSELGYDKHDDPAADELRMSIAQPFMGQDQNDGGGNGKSLSVGIAPLTIKVDRSSPRYKLWKSFDDFVRKKEIAYSRLMAKYFREQRDRLIKKLDDISQRGVLMGNILFKLTHTKDDLPSDDELFNMDFENSKLEEIVIPYVGETMRQSAHRVYDTYNIDASFNVNNPEVRLAIDALFNRSKKINKVTFESIRGLLQQGYEQSWSYAEMAKQIQSMYSDFSRGRANTIARTEMAGAVNSGALEGYKQAGIEKKEWLATMDGSTRDSHAQLDGEVVNVTESFTQGNFPMNHPGDPSAPPEETINCRCALLPILEE